MGEHFATLLVRKFKVDTVPPDHKLIDKFFYTARKTSFLRHSSAYEDEDVLQEVATWISLNA